MKFVPFFPREVKPSFFPPSLNLDLDRVLVPRESPVMGIREISRSGVTIRMSRLDAYNLLDIRTKSGETVIFTAAISPGGWTRFKNAMDAAEQAMVRAGWLNTPRSELGEILQLAKGE